MDFMNDEAFWKRQEEDPAQVYLFAIPCENFSKAHTWPVVRSVENPYGDETIPEVAKANEMLWLFFLRVIVLIKRVLQF